MNGRNLQSDYLAKAPALQPFFNKLPEALLETALLAHDWHPGLREELAAYQTHLGNDIAPPANAVIVTGQQPGLLTGPLYTIYKIATAIRLADRVSETSGTPCSPVFWLGSDDHDFEEARIAHVLTRNHEPLAITYTPEAIVEGLSMFRVPIEPSMHSLVDLAADSTPGSEFRDEIRSFLHESIDASQSLADWTARLIARLFRGANLTILTTELPQVRLAAREIYAREISEPLLSTRLVNEQGQRLRRLGYEPQVEKNDNECGFFLDVGDKRRKVIFENGSFVVPAENLRLTPTDLAAVLNAEPLRFSPNVALRCIVQQKLFPTNAYVAGPGEIAYWAQFKTLFECFEVPMPVVFPRAQAVLTTLKLKKLCDKFGFQPGALAQTHPEALLNEALRISEKSPHYDAFKKHRASIDSALESLSKDLARAPLSPADLHERLSGELDRFERGLLRADDSRVDASRQQVTRLCNTFAPFRKPQERVYTIFSFLFEHGWDLVPRITRELDVTSFRMNEIEL